MEGKPEICSSTWSVRWSAIAAKLSRLMASRIFVSMGFKLEESVHLWEVDGQIVAMLNPDSTGEAFFQFHPGYRSEELLCEMLDAAEARLPNQKEAGRRELITWVNEQDVLHKDGLTRRGYTRSKYKAEHMRYRFLTQPVQASDPPYGYTVRALGDESELPARSWLMSSRPLRPR